MMCIYASDRKIYPWLYSNEPNFSKVLIGCFCIFWSFYLSIRFMRQCVTVVVIFDDRYMVSENGSRYDMEPRQRSDVFLGPLVTCNQTMKRACEQSVGNFEFPTQDRRRVRRVWTWAAGRNLCRLNTEKKRSEPWCHLPAAYGSRRFDTFQMSEYVHRQGEELRA